MAQLSQEVNRLKQQNVLVKNKFCCFEGTNFVASKRQNSVVFKQQEFVSKQQGFVVLKQQNCVALPMKFVVSEQKILA